ARCAQRTAGADRRLLHQGARRRGRSAAARSTPHARLPPVRHPDAGARGPAPSSGRDRGRDGDPLSAPRASAAGLEAVLRPDAELAARRAGRGGDPLPPGASGSDRCGGRAGGERCARVLPVTSAAAPALSVVVPVYNEEGNVEPLAAEIGRAVAATGR